MADQLATGIQWVVDDSTGAVTGYRRKINGVDTAFALDAEAIQASVSGAGGGPVQRPWRIASFGDSRAAFMGTNTVMVPSGSASALNRQRVLPWLVTGLGDAEAVASFGVSGDTAALWASTSRANSKTYTNLITASGGWKGGRPDAVYVQYGINDYVAGSSAATVSGHIKALCVTLMGAGMRVILEATNPGTAAGYGSGPAAKLQATIDGNAILRAWAAGYPNQLVFVDTFNSLVDGTGYLSSAYENTDAVGLHFNWLGAMVSGAACATAARALLPARPALAYTCGSLLQPNLIGLDAPTMFTVADVGTITYTTPTWNIDATTGMPYAEVTATCTVLAGGYARGHLEIHPASGVISGATPRHSIAVGDELQGSAYITVDDGVGGVAPIQSVMLRQRFYTDTKFADDGQFISAAGPTLQRAVAGRFTTPTIVSATASGAIAVPAAGAAYCLQPHVEFNAVGQVSRMRVYAPSLRVVGVGIQPSRPAAGASPYTYTNTTGAPLMLYIAGGTVSAITLARQGTALTTGFTAGVFYLAQNDSATITYTVAPTLTVQPVEAR